jgi:alpha-glucosidase (family GH31 glycosyl hydrolase)
MPSPVSRREALRRLGAAGASVALGGTIIRGRHDDLIVADQPVEVVVSSVNPATARLTIRARTASSDASLDDGALVQASWGRQQRVRAATPASGIRAGDLRVHLVEDPLSIRVSGTSASPRASDAPAQQTLAIDRDTGALTFSLAGDGPLLGFGEGGRQFDRAGATDRMRSGQVTDRESGYAVRTNGGRVPIQWLIRGSTAIYIHQPLGTFDLTGRDGRFSPPAGAPLPLDIFVVVSNPAGIMRAFADITGYPEMPPLWSLGYLQSHRTLAGPDEIRAVAETMRAKRLPCDALIYLGTDFTPSGWNTHNGEFTFNPANFPDPKRQIDELHALHYRVVLHVVTEGSRMTGTVNDSCPAPEPSGRTSDNRWPPERRVGCYWPVHKALFDVGIDGWWPDQGDGYDAASRLTRVRMYWDGSQKWRSDERPFALHRNGYAGMARYAAFLWSGDVFSLWETLRDHVPVAINCGLSGMPYWGTDIGGFYGTPEFTGELFVRWFQFAAFCPLFRSHGRNWHLHLPWGWDGGDGGPPETQGFQPDPAELHNAAVEPICRKYLELRYRLLPYTYSAVREGHESGVPLVRALWLHHPDDSAAVVRGDEYLWGRDLLVAPVVEKGATSRRLYLPHGVWFDYWTEERIEGGLEIDRPVDLETMPLFVRAGAIVPLGPVKQYTDEAVDGPLTLAVYPGADGTTMLYEDDGKSFAYRRGGWMKTHLEWRDRDRRLTIALSPGSRMLPPAVRIVEVRLAGSPTSRRIDFTGKPLEIRL